MRAPSCRVPSLARVDIDKYIEHSWYIQMQQVNGYQPRNSLNCVVATYEDEGRKVELTPWGPTLFSGKTISVYNYANAGGVNAPVQRPVRDGQVLCSRLPDPRDTSKLLVAPCFLPFRIETSPATATAVPPAAVISATTPSATSLEGSRPSRETP